MITIEGEDRLNANLNRLMDDVEKARKDALKKAGMKIVARAQRNMRTAGYNGGTLNNTGRLSQSGRTEEASDGTVDAGFFSKDGERGYAAAVEYGSCPHWSPRYAIEAWVHKKLRVPAKDAPSVAFLINRVISKKGTRAHPFFEPAVNTQNNDVTDTIGREISKVINKGTE